MFAVAVLAAGCANDPQDAATQPPPTTAAATTSAPVPTATATTPSVPEVLKFTATTVDGKSFDGSSVAGKPVVFWFWAAWCPKCRADAPAMRALQANLAGRMSVVGVAGLGSGDQGMKTFVSNYQLSGFPQLADDKGDVWKRFKVPSQHYYVVLDASGNELHRGSMTAAQLAQKLG